VRVGFSPGVDGLTDELEGVLKGLDERRLALAHPVLGELSLDRDRVGELRWLFRGRRVEIDNAFHPLGEGEAWQGAVRPDVVPKGARLVVHAVRPEGDFRVEAVVNGKKVGPLTCPVDTADEWRRLVGPLPAEALRAGDNSVELRAVAGRDTGRRESYGV